MPREIEPRPATVQRQQESKRQRGGKNLRVLHTNVDSWPKGHVIAPNELHEDANVRRLIALGAVEETDDPATGGLDESALPPGAAVTHQMSPGDELPPNALEVAKEGEATASNVDDMNVTELHARASELDIEGRSSMDANQLRKAIRKAEKK
jgi:hypothetical protein